MSPLSLKSWVIKARALPFRIFVNAIIHKLRKGIISVYAQKIGKIQSTYSQRVNQLTDPLFSIPSGGNLEEHRGWILPLAERYAGHRFNLLGSGWIHIYCGMRAKGLEGHCFPPVEPTQEFDRDGDWLAREVNPSNVKHARQIWSVLKKIQVDYVPLDWHIAFKSGYRWPSNVWNTVVRKDLPIGVDIKEPWELARMQHLSILAYASVLVGGRMAERYLQEFQCQILDFICQNPPGFGVNWACPMDVSIRMVNWLVAFDFFRTGNLAFDREFKRIFSQSICDHARFVFRFREYSAIENGNHYLSNLCGLIFAAAYFPDKGFSQKWLRFALPEFIKEMELQFNPDGSNFEGSVSYHRLSAEMVAYTTGVIQKMRRTQEGSWKTLLSERDLSQLASRLGKMAEFSLDVTNSAGRVWQIGDNDSGRFLKLQPSFLSEMEMAELCPQKGAKDSFSVENTLNHGALVAAIHAITNDGSLSGFHDNTALDYWAMGNLIGNIPVSTVSPENGATRKHGLFGGKFPELDLSGWSCIEISFPSGGLRKDLQVKAYADFGLYIFASSKLHLAVRCGGRKQCRKSGHMHEDQFSICLSFDGKEYISDPGTYLYTPAPEWRNRYRSASAHFVPSVLHEERDYLRRPVFAPLQGEEKECLAFGSDFFIGGNVEGNAEIAINIDDDGIRFYSRWGSYPEMDKENPVSFSCGYGVK